MAKIPHIPLPGEEVKAAHIAEIIRWVKSIVPSGDGKTIKAFTTDGGTTLTSFSSAAGSQLSYCFLKSRDTRTTANGTDFDLGRCFIGDIISDGISLTPTEVDVPIRIVTIATLSEMDNIEIPWLNTYPYAYFPCWKFPWMNFDTDQTELLWTCQPEVWR